MAPLSIYRFISLMYLLFFHLFAVGISPSAGSRRGFIGDEDPPLELLDSHDQVFELRVGDFYLSFDRIDLVQESAVSAHT